MPKKVKVKDKAEAIGEARAYLDQIATLESTATALDRERANWLHLQRVKQAKAQNDLTAKYKEFEEFKETNREHFPQQMIGARLPR